MRTLAYALVASGFSVSSALAATVRVVPSAGDATGDWVGAYTDIQAAVDAASDGDTVLLKSGTYALSGSHIAISDRSLTLRGEAEGKVIIDACGNSRCLAVTISAGRPSPVPVAVENLVFRNGYYDNAADTSDANFKAWGVGALFRSESANSRIFVRHCIVENCTNNVNVSGVSCRAGGFYLSHYVTVEDSTIRNCAALNNTDANSGGGGMWTAGDDNADYSRSPIVVRCVISGCKANTRGSGVFSYNMARFEDCTFDSNNHTSYGIGIFGGNYCQLLGCRFTNNRQSATMYGSAIYVGGTGMVVSNCFFASNSSESATIYGSKPKNITIDRCVFSNETSRAYQNEYAGNMRISNSLFVETKWPVCQGSGAGTCTLDNCTFVKCKEYTLRAISQNGFVLNNCLFNGNATDFFIGKSSTLQTPYVFTNCCVSAYPAEGKYVAVDCLQGVDPKFADASHGNYRLSGRSPCRDAGKVLCWMNSGSLDLDGNPRVVTDGRPFAQNPGALPDIGCYEYPLANPGFMIFFR